jgi:hypothetical protein
LQKSEDLRHRDDRAFAYYKSFYLGYRYMNLGAYPMAIEHFEVYLRSQQNDTCTKEAVDWCRRELSADQLKLNI